MLRNLSASDVFGDEFDASGISDAGDRGGIAGVITSPAVIPFGETGKRDRATDDDTDPPTNGGGFGLSIRAPRGVQVNREGFVIYAVKTITERDDETGLDTEEVEIAWQMGGRYERGTTAQEVAKGLALHPAKLPMAGVSYVCVNDGMGRELFRQDVCRAA